MKNVKRASYVLLRFAVLIVALGAASSAQAQTQTRAQDQNVLMPEDYALQVFEDSLETEKIEEEAQKAEVAFTGVEEIYRRNIAIRPADVTPANLTSLFFNKWQYALLVEAKRGFLSRPSQSRSPASNNDMMMGVDEEQKPRGIRELFLSGISYASPKTWTIWLNGQRVTPGALPPQVMDLKVSRDYIDLKWFDEYSNLIFPIRIRPHERFNLDSRIFLPGTEPQ